jgi:cellulose synthase/poly-beta-1,6-N-acetylglucosamine synthase-like glycosyltransferase
MHITADIVLAIYITGLVMIMIFTMMQLHLLVHYRAHRDPERRKCSPMDIRDCRHAANISSPAKETVCPVVTVQLPVYNEHYVIERLIRAAANLDWPADKLEIQLLDDSTDDTTFIIDKHVKQLASNGLNIIHIRRKSRTGYKAGALQNGLNMCAGEFIAIFDSDFVPSADFLQKTVPYFELPETGMIQTRWTHLNKTQSLLTRLQAMALDAHFSVEQAGRNYAGYFMNFNGTAGIWRKTCLIDSGGWEHDTLTEDLDISYRAQLKGWKFIFLEDVVTPAELPVAVSALKSQQYRWSKGAAQTARKNLPDVIRSRFPLMQKLHAISHLLNSSVFIWIFLISFTSLPILWFNSFGLISSSVFHSLSVFLIGLLVWICFYETSMRFDHKDAGTRWAKMITHFPPFLALSMGLGFHNTVAVLSGYSGRESPFIRTPKFNAGSSANPWQTNRYLAGNIGFMGIVEGILMLYFLLGVISSFLLNDYGYLIFHILLTAGYGILFIRNVYESVLTSATLRAANTNF